MKFLSKYWKALVAILMAAASVPLFLKAQSRSEEYDRQQQNLNTSIAAVQAGIDANSSYAGVQGAIDGELERLDASRRRLYDRFPAALLEEDQIRYILYLEEVFGGEISFAFAQEMPVATLSDGNYIGGMTFTLNYQTTYQGFKDLVTYLASDSRVASVRVATLDYVQEQDIAAGTITLTLYTVSANEYEPPEASEHDTGKGTIFE